MKKTIEYVILTIFAAVTILLSNWLGHQALLWMPVQASADASKVDELFSFLVALGTVIFLPILGMIGYSIATCRAAPDDYDEGHPSRGDVRIELLWTGIPVLLVLAIAGYSYSIYQQMDIRGPTGILGHQHLTMGVEPAEAATVKNNNQAPETIEVISKQWSWTFHYPKNNITSNELHLPVNQRVNLVLRSQDVLHGFYVPEFRIKQDIIPNRVINLQFQPIRIGKYQLQDSQFDGTYFALMQANVFVDSAENYAKWLAQAVSQKPAPAINPAANEHAQPPKRVFTSNWYTVEPSLPDEVNYSS